MLQMSGSKYIPLGGDVSYGTETRTAFYFVSVRWGPSSSSSYELQHALHMRSIMHCFVWRGVRGYLNILVVVIVKF